MTTPYDSLPIEVRRAAFGWFGEPWPSYVCYSDDGHLLEETRKPFPAGESCLWCDEPFDEAAGDSGTAMPCTTTEGSSVRHVHKECAFMNVVGPLAHHEGRCRCHGGSTETPGMTVRQEALEVWRRYQPDEAAP
jgi:hypothetical protein